jgi:hypothetical protein
VGQRAYVFLRRSAGNAERYIGAAMVEPSPAKGRQVQFSHAGKLETGRVDDIRPPDWTDDSEAVPTIRIRQYEPAAKKSPAEF